MRRPTEFYGRAPHDLSTMVDMLGNRHRMAHYRAIKIIRFLLKGTRWCDHIHDVGRTPMEIRINITEVVRASLLGDQPHFPRGIAILAEGCSIKTSSRGKGTSDETRWNIDADGLG